MTAKNEITGDKIATKIATESYRNNYDQIFNKTKENSSVPKPQRDIDTDQKPGDDRHE